jgi:hypothetical protein
MRDLTKKQKDLIRTWVKASRHKEVWETFYSYDINDIDDLTNEQWETLQEIHDTEILYQTVNNFIQDLNQI